MEDKAIAKLINKLVKPFHPEIESFDIIYNTRNGLCEILIYVDGTEYEQEQEIEYEIITSLEKFFNMDREKINIFYHLL